MIVDLDIPLKEKQIHMYNLLNSGQYTEFLFYGASRSGKTFLILYWMMVQCIVYKANCLVVRLLFTSMQQGMINQTLPDILRAIAKHNGYSKWENIVMPDGTPFVTHNRRDNILKFYNGAYIQFASLRGSSDTASSYDKILSTEWGHIFVDEVSEVDEMAIDTLRSRLAQRLDSGTNIMLFALNPTSKTHWTYIRYFLHKTNQGEIIPKSVTDKFYKMHFSIKDNEGNISANYEDTLMATSSLTRKRFLDGLYSDEMEGEVFKTFTWDECPPADEFTMCIIYTDPSAKDQKTNDYKASVLLGMARQKIWLISARAVQGTSYEMLENIYELYQIAPVTPRIFMEKRQVPIDFDKTFVQFQIDKNWICNLEWDTRNHGDKFTNIESTLEPLFRMRRFIFCHSMKESGVCEITKDQFARFSRKIQRDRKDDLPDACAKGTSILLRTQPLQKPQVPSQSTQFMLVTPGTMTNLG